MRAATVGSDLAEAAQQYVDDNNIGVVFDPSDGTYWDSPNNRIVMNPADNHDAAQSLVHEVNHAQGEAVSLAAWQTGTRQEYVDAMFSEETEGTVESIQMNTELRAAGRVPTQTFPLEPEYNSARTAAIDSHRAAHPEATEADLNRVGDAAGSARVRQGFIDGEVTTSTNGQTYPDYYGDSYDAAHNPPPPGGP